MRRTPLAVAIAALAIPASASAAITHVYATVDGTVLCVEDASVSQLTFQVLDSTGQLIEPPVNASAVTAPCPGGSGTTSFIPTLKTGYPRFPFGATIKVLGDGSPLSLLMPVASWDSLSSTALGERVRTTGGASGSLAIGTTRLENVPAGSSVSGEGVSTTVGASGSLAIRTTAPDPLTISETAGGVPFTAVISPRQFAATITTPGNSTAISVEGMDPIGARGTAILRSPRGKVIATAPLDPRPGADEVASAALNRFSAGPGDTITVSQPNWFIHTIRAASAGLLGNGFNVSIPSGGETATYSASSQVTAIDTVLPRFTFESTSDPALACQQLGPAVSCAGGSAHYSVAARGFAPAAGDALKVLTSDPGGDSLTYTLTQKGGWGSLDDGNIAFFSLPGTHGIARIQSGGTKLVRHLKVGSQGFTPDDSTGGEPFAVHVRDGARIAFGGPAFAGFKPYTFRLAVEARFRSGGTGMVTGATYPHAQVLVIHSDVSRVSTFLTTADGRGRFRVTVPNVRVGDMLDAGAVQPGGHGNWITTTSAAGALHPRMQGPADRARVSGTVRYTVAGAGGSPTWTLYLAGGGALPKGHGRFFELNTSKLANGIYRVEVIGTGISMIDYRYLIIRH